MILHLPGETALRLLRVRAGRCELALLVEPEQEVESVRASVLQAVGETGQTIETELMNTRNRLGKTDNSLVYFFHDGMTNLMESNVREVGVGERDERQPSFAVAAITPREMMAAVPDLWDSRWTACLGSCGRRRDSWRRSNVCVTTTGCMGANRRNAWC